MVSQLAATAATAAAAAAVSDNCQSLHTVVPPLHSNLKEGEFYNSGFFLVFVSYWSRLSSASDVTTDRTSDVDKEPPPIASFVFFRVQRFREIHAGTFAARRAGVTRLHNQIIFRGCTVSSTERRCRNATLTPLGIYAGTNHLCGAFFLLRRGVDVSVLFHSLLADIFYEHVWFRLVLTTYNSHHAVFIRYDAIDTKVSNPEQKPMRRVHA